MARYIYVAALLLTAAISVQAQSNFKQGYIITNSNDTLKGLVDFRTDRNNSRECHFKLESTAKTQVFKPMDIISYRFIDEGKYYVSHEIEINEEKQSVFLEFLVQGMLNLYYYREPDLVTAKDYYFIEDKNGKMLPLSQKEAEVRDNKIREDVEYKRILTYTFGDYPEMISTINQASYNRSSMIDIVKEYHDLTCTDGSKCIEFENNNKSFIKADFSLYIGAQIIEYKWDILEFDNTKSFSPSIGLQLNISDPRIVKSLSLQADATFSVLRGESQRVVDSSDYYFNKFSALMLGAKVGFQYTYTKGKFRPSIGAGYGMTFLMNKSSKCTRENQFLGEFHSKTIKNEYLPGSQFHGYNLNIGADYVLRNNSTISLRVSYEDMTEINDRKDGRKDKLKITQLKLWYTF